MLTATQPEVEEYYGIVTNPEDGFADFREAWATRVEKKYKKIELNIPVEETTWRSIKTGTRVKWTPKILSDVSVNGQGVVVEDYINLDVLSWRQNQRLFLEHLSNLVAKVKGFVRSKSQSTHAEVLIFLQEIGDELSHAPPRTNILDSIYDLLEIIPELTEKYEAFPEIISASSQIQEIVHKERFQELDHMMRVSSNWVESCQQMREIHTNNLYRFSHVSFANYCSSIISPSNPRGITSKEGLNRVRSAELVERLIASELPVPQNKGQAFALCQIPTENQAKVWQTVLESESKPTSKLIRKTHEEIVFGKQIEPDREEAIALLIAKIKDLIDDIDDEQKCNIGDLTLLFLDQVSSYDCTVIQEKMIKAIYIGVKRLALKERGVRG